MSSGLEWPVDHQTGVALGCGMCLVVVDAVGVVGQGRESEQKDRVHVQHEPGRG